MSYDDGRYTSKKQYGPIWGTFAQVIATVTTKVQTSAVSNDRVEFMRKIKATGFKFLTQTGTTQGGSAADYTYSVREHLPAHHVRTRHRKLGIQFCACRYHCHADSGNLLPQALLVAHPSSWLPYSVQFCHAHSLGELFHWLGM